MEERGDGQKIRPNTGKGIERLEISFGGEIIPLIPKCISSS